MYRPRRSTGSCPSLECFEGLGEEPAWCAPCDPREAHGPVVDTHLPARQSGTVAMRFPHITSGRLPIPAMPASRQSSEHAMMHMTMRNAAQIRDAEAKSPPWTARMLFVTSSFHTM